MTIYDFASRAYDGARGALSALDEQIQRLEPEVEAARAASTQAEMDTSITDAAFDAVAAMEKGEVIDLDSELAMEAAAVGLEENLAFADSVIYAVAKKCDATLWTQDVHFRGKPGVKFKAKAR